MCSFMFLISLTTWHPWMTWNKRLSPWMRNCQWAIHHEHRWSHHYQFLQLSCLHATFFMLSNLCIPHLADVSLPLISLYCLVDGCSSQLRTCEFTLSYFLLLQFIERSLLFKFLFHIVLLVLLENSTRYISLLYARQVAKIFVSCRKPVWSNNCVCLYWYL